MSLLVSMFSVSEQKKPQLKVFSVQFNPESVRVDDELFPASIFTNREPLQQNCTLDSLSADRMSAADYVDSDVIPNFDVQQIDEDIMPSDEPSPFVGMSEASL